MGQQQIFKVHHLANGITLLGEEMESVSSAAMSILVPIGAATDTMGQEGAANLLVEMFSKGAGPWSSKELSEQFENLGIRQSLSAGTEASFFSFACLGENLKRAMELASITLLQPRFPDEELESVRELALQDLNALEDEPAQKVMVELCERFYPFPFGRSQMGTIAGVKAVTIQSIRDYYKAYFTASRTIIGIAGKFDWEEMKAAAEDYFGSWKG